MAQFLPLILYNYFTTDKTIKINVNNAKDVPAFQRKAVLATKVVPPIVPPIIPPIVPIIHISTENNEDSDNESFSASAVYTPIKNKQMIMRRYSTVSGTNEQQIVNCPQQKDDNVKCYEPLSKIVFTNPDQPGKKKTFDVVVMFEDKIYKETLQNNIQIQSFSSSQDTTTSNSFTTGGSIDHVMEIFIPKNDNLTEYMSVIIPLTIRNNKTSNTAKKPILMNFNFVHTLLNQLSPPLDNEGEISDYVCKILNNNDPPLNTENRGFPTHQNLVIFRKSTGPFFRTTDTDVTLSVTFITPPFKFNVPAVM